jgi:hypothetical protein
VNRVQNIKQSKQKNSTLRSVWIKSIKQSKIKSSILRTVQVNVSKLSKSITKGIKVVFIQKAGEIGTTFYRLISVARVQTVRLSKLTSKKIRPVLINIAKNNKVASKSIKAVQVNIIRINKVKITIFRVVKIQSIKWQKLTNKSVYTVQVQTIKLRKLISKSIHTVWIKTIHNNKQITKLKKLVQTNIAQITKQKIWNPRATEVQGIHQNKVKTVILLGLEVFTVSLKKSITKSLKTVYVQKAGEIGTTFYRIVAAVLIQTAQFSKSLTKNVQSNLIRTARLSKTKSTNITTTEVQNTRINKQKRWNAKADQVQNVEQTKQKKSTIRTVQVWVTEIIRGTIFLRAIKVTDISPFKFTKNVSKTPKAAQVVSATITRASTSNRRITSGITYTIGSYRTVTLYRQFKAVMINTFRANKGIHKDITASSTNTSIGARSSIPWKFLIQFVTKIISFNRQTIEKPGHALPDPDPWDPNMIDPSTPSADGLVYGNPDDDR